MTATQQTGGQSGNTGNASTPTTVTSPKRFAWLRQKLGDHGSIVLTIVLTIAALLLFQNIWAVVDALSGLSVIGLWGILVLAVAAFTLSSLVIWVWNKADMDEGLVQFATFNGASFGFFGAIMSTGCFIVLMWMMDTRIKPTALPAETPAIQTQTDGESTPDGTDAGSTTVSLPSFQEIDGVSAAAMFHARDVNAWYAYCGYQSEEKGNNEPSGVDFVQALKDYKSWSADKPDPFSPEVVNRRSALIRLAGLDDKSGKWEGENKKQMDEMFGLK